MSSKLLLEVDQWYQQGSIFKWNQHDVFYKTMGNGEPLLMIHGFPESSWIWKESSEILKEHFTIVVVDLLDYGRSKNHLKKRCSIMDQVNMIESLLSHLNIQKMHVVAHDVGDTVAQEILSRHNEGSLNVGLMSMILMNGGMLPHEHRALGLQKQLLSPWGFLYALFLRKETLASAVTYVQGGKTKAKGEHYDFIWSHAIGVNGRGGLSRKIHYMSDRLTHSERWVNALVDAKIPMMFINGNQDPVSGIHAAQALKELVPRVNINHLPEVGHFPPTEASQEVTECIKAFHNI